MEWEDWSGGELLDTTNRWISADGHGRLTERSGSGAITKDLVIVPASPRSTAAKPSSASPLATPAATSGTDPEAVEYPGAVPANSTALRSYLADADNDAAHIGQRIAGLLFARTLDTEQDDLLVTLAKNITREPVATSTTPNGQSVQLVAIPPLPASAQWWLALSTDGSTIVGVCYDQAKQTWRTLVTSGHTTTAN